RVALSHRLLFSPRGEPAVRRFPPVLAAMLVLTGRLSAADSPPAVDFLRDIAPIFQKSCVRCHGADKQKGGLRLDRRDDALAGGNSGRVLVPKASAQSKLFQAVSG